MARNDVSTIHVENLKETQYVLQRMDPELSGKLVSRIKRAVEVAAEEARAFTLALSEIKGKNGNPSPLAEHAVEAAASIVVKKARKGYQIRQADKVASIVEFAAQGKTPQGRKLVEVLNRHYGQTGRFVWEAVDRKRDETMEAVQLAVSQTIEEANAKLGQVL